jgi:hypothetical protein
VGEVDVGMVEVGMVGRVVQVGLVDVWRFGSVWSGFLVLGVGELEDIQLLYLPLKKGVEGTSTETHSLALARRYRVLRAAAVRHHRRDAFPPCWFARGVVRQDTRAPQTSKGRSRQQGSILGSEGFPNCERPQSMDALGTRCILLRYLRRCIKQIPFPSTCCRCQNMESFLLSSSGLEVMGFQCPCQGATVNIKSAQQRRAHCPLVSSTRWKSINSMLMVLSWLPLASPPVLCWFTVAVRWRAAVDGNTPSRLKFRRQEGRTVLPTGDCILVYCVPRPEAGVWSCDRFESEISCVHPSWLF